MTWDEYAASLEDKIGDLHRAAAAAHIGRCRRGGSTSRRQTVGNGRSASRRWRTRSSRRGGEDADAIYEAEFLGFSYGFRPGRCQHDALDALAFGIKGRNVRWILDADIRSFFDRISHDWLIRFLEHRIGDRRIIRLIQKWLKAGVLEEGAWTEGEQGTPQGAVITPPTILRSSRSSWGSGSSGSGLGRGMATAFMAHRW